MSVNQRPTSATEALHGLKNVLEKGVLNTLSGPSADQHRILVDQREHTLELIVRPRGFRVTKANSWLDLLILIFTFSMSSSILGGMTTLFLFRASGLYSFRIFRLIFGILGFTSGFAGMVLLPTPARNHLLSHLHICLSDDDLIIRRETFLVMRSQQILFQTKREDVLQLKLELTKNILEINTSDRPYILKFKPLGLAPSESQWLAQEISNTLGVNLISN